ncbi:MAG TPA: UDP-N-acetylglucosamine 2-epimerase (non-hydrolyzing) [Candidatus Limiplasma sp.]|nr:UDP-N-acetylglucosamine 2-epimerase (non-hydrolyzing) [Candidatus Limiplasma sp.]
MIILTVVGARPQFIKAAALSRVLRQKHTEILVHTGQHYDPMMSDIFFEELAIPKPDYNLGIAGGTHAEMTARMLSAIDDTLVWEKPDALLVYGDTNSTLAAALAAVKRQIPILHVEAGNRLHTLQNPEEINRVLTDHMATKLFACVHSAMDELQKENLADRAYLVGDPMYDAFTYYRSIGKAEVPATVTNINGAAEPIPETYCYLTCHREENTKDERNLSQVLQAMEELEMNTYYPVHPRNLETVIRLREQLSLEKVKLLAPLGYLESIAMVSHAQHIVTDSGGVQREAYFAQVPCVTVFDYAVWPETMHDYCNQLAKPDQHDILCKLQAKPNFMADGHPFGDGHACEKIVSIIDRGL